MPTYRAQFTWTMCTVFDTLRPSSKSDFSRRWRRVRCTKVVNNRRPDVSNSAVAGTDIAGRRHHQCFGDSGADATGTLGPALIAEYFGIGRRSPFDFVCP